ncbi:FKBP-type peptidyl-prolyl cis-trans isomerase [Fibrobacterota bacterium]
MKHLFGVVAALSLLMVLAGCEQDSSPKANLNTPDGKFSYAIGLEIGGSLKNLKAEIDLGSLMQGIKDTLLDGNPQMTATEAMELKKAHFQAIQEGLKKKNMDEGESFLAENKKKPGIITTESGLQYEIMAEGSGDKPTPEDKVSVHYTGTLLDGTEFDSSRKRGQPVTFDVKGVIPGWTEVLQLMQVGSKFRVFIPSKLAYAERGAGQKIGPNATLIFEMELLEIKRAK